LVNFYLSAECEVLICTFSSNWGRLIYEYMIADKGYAPPTISIDKMYKKVGSAGRDFFGLPPELEICFPRFPSCDFVSKNSVILPNSCNKLERAPAGR